MVIIIIKVPDILEFISSAGVKVHELVAVDLLSSVFPFELLQLKKIIKYWKDEQKFEFLIHFSYS